MSREKLAENIVTFVPLMFKKIIKGMPSFDIPKQQIGLLFHIKKEAGRPMSYYSEMMMIPKSNLTVLSEKLIEEGLIEREFDDSDRRVINLKITGKGEEYLEEYKLKVRSETEKKLEVLPDGDVERLNELFTEMREIFNKLI